MCFFGDLHYICVGPLPIHPCSLCGKELLEKTVLVTVLAFFVLLLWIRAAWRFMMKRGTKQILNRIDIHNLNEISSFGIKFILLVVNFSNTMNDTFQDRSCCCVFSDEMVILLGSSSKISIVVLRETFLCSEDFAVTKISLMNNN